MPFPRPGLRLGFAGIRLGMGRVRVFWGVGADEFEFRTRPHLSVGTFRTERGG